MAEAPRTLRLFSISNSAPFLETLADAINDDTLPGPDQMPDDPLQRSDLTVLLPTRRACRAFRDVLLERARGGAIILPRIRPIGDADEDDLLFTSPDTADLAILPAISSLTRHRLLARLVLKWRETVASTLAEPFGDAPIAIPANVADAVNLAGHLMRLLDSVDTEGASLDGLASLVPDDHAGYYQITLAFLKIVTDWWPEALAELGVLNPAQRRNLLIDGITAGIRGNPDGGPIIAAGSTGSIPASARLLAAIAAHPRGSLVLPGLDMALEQPAFDAIIDDEQVSHPQFGMAQLLRRLNASRDDVVPIATDSARALILSEAMRPATRTDAWSRVSERIDSATARTALADVTVLVAENEREEALSIALALRDAIRDADKTAALVTPDRNLAARVAAELRRWDLAIDDSAGVALSRSLPGVFSGLLLDAVSSGYAPIEVLALMKHPLFRLCRPVPDVRELARDLDENVLRGVRPAPGLAGIIATAEVVKCTGSVMAFLRELEGLTAPLDALFRSVKPVPLEEFVRAHWRVMVNLSTCDKGVIHVAANEAGEELATYVSDLLADDDAAFEIEAPDYPAVFAAFMAGRTVRPTGPSHPRLQILGLLEARLQSADLVILGGLNEQVWPDLPAADPWLSRPMRAALGLAAPERRIGLMAHDFAQSTAQGQVILSRALKSDGTPTIASRWLQRLQAVTGRLGIEDALDPDPTSDYRLLARQIDAARLQPAARPAPSPPVALRPRDLSVTQIEKWVRDPYSIFAGKILRLEPLEDIDAPPDASDRGTLIHNILAVFMRDPPTGDVAADLARLIETGEHAFAAFVDRPEVSAVWWPRFVRIAEAFVALEGSRRSEIVAHHLEVKGEMFLSAPAGPFKLTARADRLDCFADGGVRIIDYKTGEPPTASMVVSGLNPQMTLEGAILIAGGFDLGNQDDASIAAYEYIKLSGASPPLVQKPVSKINRKPLDPSEEAARAKHALTQLVAAFDNPDQPYWPHVAAQRFRFAGDYDHLARVLEWSTGTGEDE